MGVVETLAIILAIAGSAVVVGFLLLARSGFIVSPKQADAILPQMAREPELLREIDQIGQEFTAEFWHRYHELVAKRDNESLVPDGPEHQELIQMTDVLEEWNARRMGLLFELAKLRKTSIDEVMREFLVIESSLMADAHGSGEWRAVVERLARFCCEYCRYPQKYSPEDRLSLEHILPRSRGGLTELSNLALCCQGCNNHKYNHTDGIDPQTGKVEPLFHPRTQRWDDHFRWSRDLLFIEGKTPTGRATIVRLQVNRAGPVNLRRKLIEYGEHPPPTPDLHD